MTALASSESQNHAEPRRTLKNLAVPLHCMKFMLCFDPNLKRVVACLLPLILNYRRNLGGSCIKLRPRCGSIGHLCPSVGLKAFNQTVTDEMSLGADVWQGQKRKDNVSLVLLDNETQEAAHSSSCTQAGIFVSLCRMPWKCGLFPACSPNRMTISKII